MENLTRSRSEPPAATGTAATGLLHDYASGSNVQTDRVRPHHNENPPPTSDKSAKNKNLGPCARCKLMGHATAGSKKCQYFKKRKRKNAGQSKNDSTGTHNPSVDDVPRGII